jgi:hypothetical protein
MRLPLFGPRRDEVAAIATDLITRFGLRAQHEASYLAELSSQMGSRRKKVLYEFVAREIDASFLEAQKRLGLRQSTSDLTLGAAVPEGKDDGAEPTDDAAELSELSGEAPHIPLTTADPRGLVADLNLADVDPSPRRRWRPGRASS